MNILYELQQLSLRHALLEKDAALAEYAENKSAFNRAKAEVRALARDYKDLYKRMLAHGNKGVNDGNE